MKLEIMSNKLRFERGGGPSGVLTIIVGILVLVEAFLAFFAFEWLWLRIMGGIGALVTIIVFLWIRHYISNWPVHYLEISSHHKNVTTGKIKNKMDTKEIEIPFDKIRCFRCKSRYGESIGAAYSLYAQIDDVQSLPSNLREHLSNKEEIDLMPWTQEFRKTIHKMLRFLQIRGFQVEY